MDECQFLNEADNSDVDKDYGGRRAFNSPKWIKEANKNALLFIKIMFRSFLSSHRKKETNKIKHQRKIKKKRYRI